jgi:hypothetical protein
LSLRARGNRVELCDGTDGFGIGAVVAGPPGVEVVEARTVGGTVVEIEGCSAMTVVDGAD